MARKCQETRSKHYEPIKKANELKRLEDRKICKDPTESVELQETYKQQGLVRVLDCGKEIYTWRRV